MQACQYRNSSKQTKWYGERRRVPHDPHALIASRRVRARAYWQAWHVRWNAVFIEAQISKNKKVMAKSAFSACSFDPRNARDDSDKPRDLYARISLKTNVLSMFNNNWDHSRFDHNLVNFHQINLTLSSRAFLRLYNRGKSRGGIKPHYKGVIDCHKKV